MLNTHMYYKILNYHYHHLLLFKSIFQLGDLKDLESSLQIFIMGEQIVTLILFSLNVFY